MVSIDALGRDSLSLPLSLETVLSLSLCSLAVVDVDDDSPRLDLKSASFAVSTLSTLALTLFFPFERVTVLRVSRGALAIWRKDLCWGGADVATAGGLAEDWDDDEGVPEAGALGRKTAAILNHAAGLSMSPRWRD